MFTSFTPKNDFSFRIVLLEKKKKSGMHSGLQNTKWLVHWDKLACKLQCKNQIGLIVKKSQNPATRFAIKGYTHT